MPDFSNTSAWVALVGLVVLWGINKLLATLRDRGADLPKMAGQIKDLHDAEQKRKDRQQIVDDIHRMLKEKKNHEQDHESL